MLLAPRSTGGSTLREPLVAMRRLVWLALAAGALALVLVGAHLAGIPPGELTPDPNSVAEQSAYVGVLSTLGVMLWGAVAAGCLLAGLVLRDADGRQSRFLLATAALALMLGIDDAALVHENVAPDSIGVPQRAVLALYGAIALAWAVAFRAQLWRSDVVLLGAAGVCFAASIAIDYLERSRVVEDYFKYVGLLAFTGWALVEARASLTAALRGRSLR